MSTSDPLPVNARQFRRQSSGEQAARYIRELIFEGQLAPGSHVPQDDIAQQLGMSRIPIREALIALERQGWVHIERHRGAFVHALDPAAVHDHYELYGLIYGFAARRAIERADPGFADRLRWHVKQLPEATEDASTFGREATAFHADVVDSARSAAGHAAVLHRDVQRSPLERKIDAVCTQRSTWCSATPSSRGESHHVV